MSAARLWFYALRAPSHAWGCALCPRFGVAPSLSTARRHGAEHLTSRHPDRLTLAPMTSAQVRAWRTSEPLRVRRAVAVRHYVTTLAKAQVAA